MPSLSSILLPLALILLLFPSLARSDGREDAICPSSEYKSQSESGSCNINCFRPDPVCGDDGVTYWCGCPEAACHGVHVAKRGFCHVGNGGGSSSISGQAFLLIHIVWLIVLGFSVLCGFL